MDKNEDKKSKEIIKNLFEICNKNNIKNTSSSFSFNENDLINDYFLDMRKDRLWYLCSLKLKLKKFLRLYMPHLFLFLKGLKRKWLKKN